MSYFSHPMLKKNAIQKRVYQETIIIESSKKNSLVVLPTGMGKTVIALGVAAIQLEKFKEKKILFLAPTKPLVVQHKKSFIDLTNIPEEKMCVLTGLESPKKREEIWKNNNVFFATPQVVQNDIITGKETLADFSFVIFDEAHRAAGNYAYTYIAKKYMENAKKPLILGLTASPGGDEEKIGVICGNLFVENVEIRTEDSWDVKEYIKPIDVKWIRVNLPEEYKQIQKLLESSIKKRMELLKKIHLTRSILASKKELLALQGKIAAQISKDKSSYLFTALSTVAQVIKINHALELIQSQGAEQLKKYFEKIKADKKTKAVLSILGDPDIVMAMHKTDFVIEQKISHPKLSELEKILEKTIIEDKKAIVFSQYVSTVESIVERLENKDKLKPVKFIGQRKGNTQKKQIEVLDDFRADKYNVLCATSVAEEGLDIPKVDIVIFYEPIPSDIRTIQRRGRTGRSKAGEVFILMSKGTIDEGYYWSAKRKEKNMKCVLAKMRTNYNKTGTVVEDKKPKIITKGTLAQYAEKKDKENKPLIYADVRETKILKVLSEKDAEIKTTQLAVGDFQISSRIGIERKSVDDFLQSIIDGRLFSQLKDLSSYFSRPLLIIEGDDLYGRRQIHPNAIKGALNSIAVDFRIPILWTKTLEDTADTIIAIAKREQEDGKEFAIRGTRSSLSEKEEMAYFVAGLPDVNTTIAKKLLEKFKTIKKLVNAKVEQLVKVEGIGEVKAKKIKELFEREYTKK
ncbi:MAG: DEAD/DEAH box helicase family protein [Candidatus Aenigmarchaeota archaeon]|nr:DEAD/DEAH box helicase family protein [Candidatus Aenigmarchaeota archaeon]